MKHLQKNRGRKTIIALIVCIIIVLVFIVPFGYIHDIEVLNQSYYSKEDVIKTADIKNHHLLDFSFKEAKERLEALPYISKATLTYHFPSRLTIEIVEINPYAYIPFMGTYLCVNEKGQVIEQSQKKNFEIPEIVGFTFEGFKINSTLNIENQEQWLCAKEIVDYLEKYDFKANVSRIDVYNLEEIHLYVNKLDVIMGDIEAFDEKLEGLIEIQHHFDIGVLDLRSWITKETALLNGIT